MQAKYQTDPAYKNDKAKQTERKRTAIVTGSGRGIGKETAILLAKKGVNVVICSRTEEQINSVVQEIKKEINDDQDNNNIVIGVKCDVSISSQVDCLVKSAINKFGPDSIDILVNNAGVVFNKKLVDTSEKEWDQTINGCLSSYKGCSSLYDCQKVRSHNKCKLRSSQGWIQESIYHLTVQVSLAFRV